MTDNDAAAFAAGIYPDVPELDYHSGRFGPPGSVSSTEAKRLLDCPALYKWSKENPAPPKATFDFGHTVHGMVLGTGLDIYVHDHDSLRTKAAKEDIAAARERGQVPMSRVDYARAEDAYQAVMNHPAAAALFAQGTPEQSIYSVDQDTGLWLRGRIDWTTRDADGRTVLVDLKTTRQPRPKSWARDAANLDYAVQAAWYLTQWKAVTGEDADFVHVLVGVDAPHLVSVVHMDEFFLAAGYARMRRALDTLKMCQVFNVWPAYGDAITEITPPAWYAAQAN